MTIKENLMKLIENINEEEADKLLQFYYILINNKKSPNVQTMNAIQELENGGGESFESVDEWWNAINEN